MLKNRSKKFTWVGDPDADLYVGTSLSDVIRGQAGDDTMSGGGGVDRFVFESTYSANGRDTITDFGVKGSKSGADVIDLSLALGKKITSKNISDYVQAAGDKLLVDVDGVGGTQAQVWAVLSGVKEGDQVNVRTGGFDGWITVGEPRADVKYVTVGREGIWFENVSNANGIRDNGEALITALSDVNFDNFWTIDGLDLTASEVTVRFVDGITPKALDLTGFGLDDKVVIDGALNSADAFGFASDLPAGAFTSAYVYSRGAGVSVFNNSQLVSNNWYQYIYKSAYMGVNYQKTGVQGGYYWSSFQYTRPIYNATRGYTSDYKNVTLAKGLPGGALTLAQVEVIKPTI